MQTTWKSRPHQAASVAIHCAQIGFFNVLHTWNQKLAGEIRFLARPLGIAKGGCQHAGFHGGQRLPTAGVEIEASNVDQFQSDLGE